MAGGLVLSAQLMAMVALVATSAGFVVNVLAVITFVWRGGELIGGVRQAIKTNNENTATIATELREASRQIGQNAKNIEKVTAEVAALRERVTRIERQHDRQQGSET